MRPYGCQARDRLVVPAGTTSSRPGDRPHRVEAHHDGRARVQRQLVADLTAAKELAKKVAFSRRQPDVDAATGEVDRGHVVVVAVDGEPASELVHRDVGAP